MVVANITATFKSDISTVWAIVTNLDQYAWRSDIRKIEVLEQDRGYPTTFTITVFEPMKRYEFDMENENMKGHWIGVFTETPMGTTIDFTEEIDVKKPILRLLVKGYLRKQQKQYVADLRKVLGE